MKPGILAAMLFLYAVTAYAQTSGKGQVSDRIQMIECEGINNCTPWTFQFSSNGVKGYAKWKTGEEAVLEIVGLDVSNGKIVITRTDVVGRKQGLTATYKGSVAGDQLGGEFTSSYQGNSSSGNWYAILGTKELEPPAVLHFCAAHCLTFNSEGPRQLVNYTNLPAQANERRVLSIEKFSYDSVVIRRIDTGSYPLTGEYIGQMAEDGNSVSGKGWAMTWGARLNDLPKDDEERDRRGGQQQLQAQQLQIQQLTPRDWIALGNLGVNSFHLVLRAIEDWNKLHHPD